MSDNKVQVSVIYILNSLHKSHPESLGAAISGYLEKKAAASGSLKYNDNRVAIKTPKVSMLCSQQRQIIYD
jgi:hypothetical protein